MAYRAFSPLLLAAALCCSAVLFAAGCGGQSQEAAPAAPAAFSELPDLSELAGLPGSPRRHVSAASYELLVSAPVLSSPGGSAVAEGGQLLLDPALNGGLAWAVYKLSGFPDDGSVYPTGVNIQRDFLCYLGVSNYNKGAWDISQIVFSGTLPQGGQAGLLSPVPDRAFYVAVLSTVPNTVTSLVVNCTAELPGAPNAVLNQLNEAYIGWPTRFSASGSDGGDGTITNITYDFGDGSPTYSTTDPDEVVQHEYLATGAEQASITIDNDLARSGSDSVDFTIADTRRELLVVYNDNIPESRDLAMYYSSPETGRAIDREYILGLELGADVGIGANEAVDRPTYNTTIRDEIIAFLDSNPDIKANIKYLLMIKGIPLKISSDGQASVDSDLCLLYQDVAPESYPKAEWLLNDYPGFAKWFEKPGYPSSGFYMEGATSFEPGTFDVSYDPTWNQAPSGDEDQYKLDYLVGRLTAYTWDEAKLIVDRSLAADTSRTGWIVLDSKDAEYGRQLDTMVDPVWPMADDRWDSGAELLQAGGMNVLADITDARVNKDFAGLQPDHWQNVLGYCSWGVHNGNPSDYILNYLGFEYRPGACFMSYESFNAWDTDAVVIPDDIQRQGQGQICDFLHMGGTVAIGNVYEPYTIGVGDERWVFDRYLNEGDVWIEAAYKGLRLLSWMEVVVGDPLCRVAP